MNIQTRRCKVKAVEKIAAVVKEQDEPIVGIDTNEAGVAQVEDAKASSHADKADLSEYEGDDGPAIDKELAEFINRISDSYKLTYIEAKAKAELNIEDNETFKKQDDIIKDVINKHRDKIRKQKKRLHDKTPTDQEWNTLAKRPKLQHD